MSPAPPVLAQTLPTTAQMPSWTMGPLSRTDFVRYAGAGGDLNPIHHDEPLATEAGIPSVFGMGMLFAGALGTRLARWVGPLNVRTYAVRFTGQVWPGDTLVFTGRVTGGRDAVAEIELEVLNQHGEPVIRATATAVVAAA